MPRPSRFAPAASPSIPRAFPATAWPDHESFVQRYLIPSGPPAPPATVEVEPGLEWLLQPEVLLESSQESPPVDVKAHLGPGSLLQEEMLLAPLFNMIDLLHLSEAAKWLLPYRNQLGELILQRWCDSRAAAVLFMQRRLHTIRVGVAELDCPEEVDELCGEGSDAGSLERCVLHVIWG
jgi:hypothetical protein